MASGKTHEKINYTAYAGLLIILILMGFQNMWLTLWLTVGVIFGTRYFGPDLDLKSSLYYRWGKMKWIWIPYQRMFKHRSIFTHGFVIGDIIRVIYFGVFVLGMIALINYAFNISINQSIWTLVSKFSTEFSFIFIGILIASIFHTIVDLGLSAYKRKFVYKS